VFSSAESSAALCAAHDKAWRRSGAAAGAWSQPSLWGTTVALRTSQTSAACFAIRTWRPADCLQREICPLAPSTLTLIGREIVAAMIFYEINSALSVCTPDPPFCRLHVNAG